MKRIVIAISLALLVTMALPGMAGAATLSQRVKALEKAVKAIKAVNKAQDTKIAGLKTDLTAAQGTIAGLKTDLTAAQGTISTLSSQLAAVQSNKALDLGPYVSVASGPWHGTKGPNIVFTGANVHVVDGSGYTNDQWNTPLGLGNLIVGYNSGPTMTGSHYIVCGEDNSFTGWGGFVAGFGNRANYAWSTVTGGIGNTAGGTSAAGATVSGGYGNTASAYSSAVSGGQNRSAAGQYDWVAGGLFQDN